MKIDVTVTLRHASSTGTEFGVSDTAMFKFHAMKMLCHTNHLKRKISHVSLNELTEKKNESWK